MRVGGMIAASVMIVVSGAAVAQESIKVKFNHILAPETPTGQGALKFKELAERYTAGRVTIEAYSSSQPYSAKHELAALQAGTVQMLAPPLANIGALGVKEFEVFDIPYIFPNKQALRRVTQGPLGRELLNRLDAKGITGLVFWDDGFKIMSANRPLTDPKDFQGLRMRIQSSRVLEAQMRALGALPHVMQVSKVHEALQSGIVDGTEDSPSNLYMQRMFEVQKYATRSNHGYLGYVVIANKPFWDGLPAELRLQLEKALLEATTFTNDLSQRGNDEAMAEMTRSGKIVFHDLTPEERRAWEEVLSRVAHHVAARVGKGIVARVRAEAFSAHSTGP